MGEAIRTSPRNRFIEVAARLFADRGYSATSVADIQVACGLTAGSGALYKHFSSKRQLLDAVIGTHVATMREGSWDFAASLPVDLRSALRAIIDAVWAGMHRDRAVLRVMLRDLDAFPELLNEVWVEVRTNVYEVFTEWLRAEAGRGTIAVADPGATAAVLLASLTYHPILDALIGHPPGDIDQQRFADAWVEHAVATLRLA